MAAGWRSLFSSLHGLALRLFLTENPSLEGDFNRLTPPNPQKESGAGKTAGGAVSWGSPAPRRVPSDPALIPAASGAGV